MSTTCQPNVNQMSTICQPNDNQMETQVRLGKDRLEEDRLEEREDKKAGSRFIPPTLEEVAAFIAENGYRVDAGRFIDYYTANGWMAGKTKMKDWKAAVRNWHRREKETPQQTGKVHQKFQPEGRDLSFLEV